MGGIANWMPALITLAIQAIVAVYVYGQLSRGVMEHERRLCELDHTESRQWEAINRHSQEIAVIQATCKANHRGKL